MNGADVAEVDPVIAAAHGLRDAARGHLSGVVSRVRGDAAAIRTRLDGVARRHPLARAVMVVDDVPSALAALVSILAPLGVPVLAVTHDRTAAAALRGLGAADVLVVPDYDAVPGLWRRHRCAVVVTDEGLGDRSGAELVERLDRSPRVVLVTSHDGARESLADAARAVQAAAVVRTDSMSWTDDLRAEVLRALDDACPPAAP